MAPAIHLKRIYEAPTPSDGVRVLVDRLWPRGVSKAKARIDHWPRELTPSDELRRWYHAQPGRDPEFVNRYLEELGLVRDAARRLLDQTGESPMTLLTAARNPDTGHVATLAGYLRGLRGEG